MYGRHFVDVFRVDWDSYDRSERHLFAAVTKVCNSYRILFKTRGMDGTLVRDEWGRHLGQE